MGSLWVSVARVVIPIEGVLGMVLNAMLIVYFARSKVDKTARLYHISCLISACISFYTAFLVTITVDQVGDIIDGALVGAMYGPLLGYLSPLSGNVVNVAFFTQVHAIWQFVPAPSVLQWLSLSSRPMSNLKRLVLAYSVPIVCYAIALISMILAVPDADLYEEMMASAAKRYGTRPSEFRVFGGRLFDETRISVADLAVFDFLPSFIACYVLFAVSALKIRAELRFVGGRISAKTEQMQRRFFRLQIAQARLFVLNSSDCFNHCSAGVQNMEECNMEETSSQVTLPLVLPSIPMGVLILSIALGREFGGICFLFSYIMWPIPVFTALMLLAFVRQSTPRKKKEKVKVHGKSSVTTINI